MPDIPGAPTIDHSNILHNKINDLEEFCGAGARTRGRACMFYMTYDALEPPVCSPKGAVLHPNWAEFSPAFGIHTKPAKRRNIRAAQGSRTWNGRG